MVRTSARLLAGVHSFGGAIASDSHPFRRIGGATLHNGHSPSVPTSEAKPIKRERYSISAMHERISLPVFLQLLLFLLRSFEFALVFALALNCARLYSPLLHCQTNALYIYLRRILLIRYAFVR